VTNNISGDPVCVI